MLPDNYEITKEGYYIINGITFESLNAYYDYMN